MYGGTMGLSAKNLDGQNRFTMSACPEVRVNGRNFMLRFTAGVLSMLLMAAFSLAQAPHPPLRVGIVGLVHGHVHGFLGSSLHSPEIEIVGVAEPSRQLLD